MHMEQNILKTMFDPFDHIVIPKFSGIYWIQVVCHLIDPLVGHAVCPDDMQSVHIKHKVTVLINVGEVQQLSHHTTVF